MRLPTIALSTCIAVAAMTGCTGLGTSKTDLKTELAKGTTIPPDASAGTAKVDVIFQPDSGQPQRMERSLTEPTTVQQMLVQSGGLRNTTAPRSKSSASVRAAAATLRFLANTTAKLAKSIRRMTTP